MHHRRDHEHDQELGDSRDEDADDHADRAAVLAATTEVVVAEPGTAGHEGQVDRCELLVRVDVSEDLVVGREAVGGVLQVVQQVERRDVRRVAQLVQGVEQHVAGEDHEDQLRQLRVLLVEHLRLGLLRFPPGGHRVGETLVRAARVDLAEVEHDQLLDVVSVELPAVEPVDAGGLEAFDCYLSADGVVLSLVDDGEVELLLFDGEDFALVLGTNEQLVQLAGLDLDVVHQDDGVRRKRTQVHRSHVGLQHVAVAHQLALGQVAVVARVADVQLAVVGQRRQGDGALSGQAGLVDVHERLTVAAGLRDVSRRARLQVVDDLLGVEADAVDHDDHVVRETGQIDDLRGLDGRGVVQCGRAHDVAPFSAMSRVG